MQVNFYATFRQAVGAKTVEVPVERRTTLRGLIDTLIERHPRLQRELLDPRGELYPHVHIFVNGRDAAFLNEGLEAELGPEDVVNIFPPVGGGR